MKPSNIQILILRLVIGGLFLSIGMEKFHDGWLTDSTHLAQSLAGYHQNATGWHLTYLNYVAIPYPDIWAKLMTIGELAVAASLILGLLVRLSSFMAIIMLLNFHAANGNLYSLSFFGSPWAALLIAGFLILLVARAGRWAGIDGLLSKSKPKGIFW